MKKYKKMIEKILYFLDENHYSQAVVNGSISCFKNLETYLRQTQKEYKPEVGYEWFNSIKITLSKTYLNFYKTALIKLQDVYETGDIRSNHNFKALKSYTMLNKNLKNHLDNYILELHKTLSQATANNHKYMCARFLVFVQKRGVKNTSDISYALMCCFYEEDIHSGSCCKGMVNGSVSTMMEYYYKKVKVSYGFTIILHYLSLGRGCFWNYVDDIVHEKIAEKQKSEDIVSVEDLHKYQLISKKIHIKNEYSKAIRAVNNRAVDFLILFLDMNGYSYSPEISILWFNSVRQYFGTEADAIHRAICLIAQYHNNSRINLDRVFRIKPSSFNLIPQWCKEAADRFMENKFLEGWKRSTLDMYRSSIVRLCNYLDCLGIRSFQDISVSEIKDFYLNDLHKTAAGKNAYSVRIRKFLQYLGEAGFLSNPMLFAALPRVLAPKETIVVILTETEMAQLNEKLQDQDSILSLRKKAMILLGLKMGLRSSDIVHLKYEDIDWKNSSIRFIQDKTDVEITLPMPTEVGNAIYRYITEERHTKDHQNIFLSEKAPHKPVGRAVCGRALETALPDRNVEGSGFHVTRKTFATNLLRKGVGANTVSDALGQRGTSSVHRYLSLDTDRMRMCSLTLKNCGIGGWLNG